MVYPKNRKRGQAKKAPQRQLETFRSQPSSQSCQGSTVDTADLEEKPRDAKLAREIKAGKQVAWSDEMDALPELPKAWVEVEEGTITRLAAGLAPLKPIIKRNVEHEEDAWQTPRRALRMLNAITEESDVDTSHDNAFTSLYTYEEVDPPDDCEPAHFHFGSLTKDGDENYEDDDNDESVPAEGGETRDSNPAVSGSSGAGPSQPSSSTGVTPSPEMITPNSRRSSARSGDRAREKQIASDAAIAAQMTLLMEKQRKTDSSVGEQKQVIAELKRRNDQLAQQNDALFKRLSVVDPKSAQLNKEDKISKDLKGKTIISVKSPGDSDATLVVDKSPHLRQEIPTRQQPIGFRSDTHKLICIGDKVRKVRRQTLNGPTWDEFIIHAAPEDDEIPLRSSEDKIQKHPLSTVYFFDDVTRDPSGRTLTSLEMLFIPGSPPSPRTRESNSRASHSEESGGEDEVFDEIHNLFGQWKTAARDRSSGDQRRRDSRRGHASSDENRSHHSSSRASSSRSSHPPSRAGSGLPRGGGGSGGGGGSSDDSSDGGGAGGHGGGGFPHRNPRRRRRVVRNVAGVHVTPGTYRSGLNDFYIMSPNVTQPYTSLEKEEKTEVRAHRQAAQLHAKQTFESRVPSFDGRPLDEQIPGLSALMTLYEASKSYDYTRDAHCWDINYYGDRHLADDAFRSRLGTPGEASSTPALQWFEDSPHRDDFGALMLDFKKRFVPANLDGSMQRALELIDARDYIQTPATRTFMFGDFDLDRYNQVVNKIYTSMEYLSGTTISDSQKWNNVMRHFENAPDAWNFFLRGDAHDWKSWVKATSSYRSRSLLTPSHTAMRRSQLRLPSASGHGATITDFLTDHSARKSDGGGFYSMQTADTSFCNIVPSGFDSSSHASSPPNMTDICRCCTAELDVTTAKCPCEDVPHFIDESMHSLAEGVSAATEVMDEFYLFAEENGVERPRQPIDPKVSICACCGKTGHFSRDCPNDGGTGVSVPGGRYGTAKGFKRGDDPKLRNPKYLAWRRSAQLEMQKRRGISRPVSRRAGGKFATHARRVKTGHATKPVANQYQHLRMLNVMLAGMAEELDIISDHDSSSTEESDAHHAFNQMLMSSD